MKLLNNKSLTLTIFKNETLVGALQVGLDDLPPLLRGRRRVVARAAEHDPRGARRRLAQGRAPGLLQRPSHVQQALILRPAIGGERSATGRR